MTSRMFVILVVLLATWKPIAGHAAEERRIEEEKRQSVDAAAPQLGHEYQRLLMEYGGWMNYRFMDIKNADNDDTQSDSLDHAFSIDARLWMKLTLKPAENATSKNRHSIYVRLKNLYVQEEGDSSVQRYDNDGPHLD